MRKKALLGSIVVASLDDDTADAAGYVSRSCVGQKVTLSNRNRDHTGPISANDCASRRENFGSTFAEANSSAGVAVPEHSMCLFVGLALATVPSIRVPRKSRS